MDTKVLSSSTVTTTTTTAKEVTLSGGKPVESWPALRSDVVSPKSPTKKYVGTATDDPRTVARNTPLSPVARSGWSSNASSFMRSGAVTGLSAKQIIRDAELAMNKTCDLVRFRCREQVRQEKDRADNYMHELQVEQSWRETIFKEKEMAYESAEQACMQEEDMRVRLHSNLQFQIEAKQMERKFRARESLVVDLKRELEEALAKEKQTRQALDAFAATASRAKQETEVTSHDFSREIETLESRLQELSKNLESAKQDRTTAIVERDRAASLAFSMSKELETAKHELASMQDRMVGISQRETDQLSQAQMVQAQAEAAVLSAKNAAAHAMQETSRALSEAQTELEQAKAEQARLANETDAATRAAQEAAAANAALATELKSTRRELQATRQDLRATKKELDVSMLEVQALRTHLGSTTATAGQLRADTERLRAEAQRLRAIHTAGPDALDSFREGMSDLRDMKQIGEYNIKSPKEAIVFKDASAMTSGLPAPTFTSLVSTATSPMPIPSPSPPAVVVPKSSADPLSTIIADHQIAAIAAALKSRMAASPTSSSMPVAPPAVPDFSTSTSTSTNTASEGLESKTAEPVSAVAAAAAAAALTSSPATASAPTVVTTPEDKKPRKKRLGRRGSTNPVYDPMSGRLVSGRAPSNTRGRKSGTAAGGGAPIGDGASTVVRRTSKSPTRKAKSTVITRSDAWRAGITTPLEAGPPPPGRAYLVRPPEGLCGTGLTNSTPVWPAKVWVDRSGRYQVLFECCAVKGLSHNLQLPSHHSNKSCLAVDSPIIGEVDLE